MAEIVQGTGTLYKRKFISDFVPGRPGSPASAGTPPTPGYWETRTSEVCVLYAGDPVKAISLLSSLTGRPVAAGETYIVGGKLCTTVTTSVYVPGSAGTPPTPGIPAVPGQIVYDFQLGWNARARSIPTMTYGGSFAAVVKPDAVGAMLGLTAQSADRGYADMPNAFYVRKGTVSIYEFGAEVQSVGSYPGATLKIRRYADKIQYLVNGSKVREVDATVTAPIWMSAGLYSGGDAIESPVYTEDTGGRIGGDIHAFKGFATDTDYATLDGTLQAFTGYIRVPVESNLGGSLGPFYGYLGKDAAILGGEMASFSGFMEGAMVVPTYGVIGGQIHPAIGTLNMLTGQLATVYASLQPFVGLLSDRPMGYIAGRMPAFAGALVAFPEGEAYMISDVTAGDDMVAANELVAFINSTGTITGLMSVQVLHSALMSSGATIGMSMTTQAQIEALLRSVASAVVGLLPPDKTGEAWVFNQAAGGMTRYEGYDFNSFAEVGGHYYGAKSDGIYLLEGDDDNGQSVRARVNFGRRNFGTMNHKALPEVYVGMAASGATYLRVTAVVTNSAGRPVEQTFDYRVRDNTEILKTHRFEPGRGLRATFYELELIADGQVFDLESIDFQPVELTRRL